MSSEQSFRPKKEFKTDEAAGDKFFRPIIKKEFKTADNFFRPITTADKSFRPIIITDEFETDEAADKYFRPITTKEFETDEAANNEVKGIISTYEDEKRQARQAQQAHRARLRAEADDAARIVSEYHQREKQKEQGLCVTQGGRIKNILRKKNKSNKNKSKRINKRVKKNKRNSRKYSRNSLKK